MARTPRLPPFVIYLALDQKSIFMRAADHLHLSLSQYVRELLTSDIELRAGRNEPHFVELRDELQTAQLHGDVSKRDLNKQVNVRERSERLKRVGSIALIVACYLLLASGCCLAQNSNSTPFSLPANSQPTTTQPTEPQLCWFEDPNSTDNMILGPCQTGSAENLNPTGLTPVAPAAPATPATPKPAPVPQLTPHDSGPLVASGWCVVQGRNSKPASAGDNSSSTASRAPGCDIGLGVSLFTRNRLSFVSVLGTRTLGVGLALVVVKPTPNFPRVVALALGLVVQYDSSGIYRQVYPALGATMSFKGQQ